MSVLLLWQSDGANLLKSRLRRPTSAHHRNARRRVPIEERVRKQRLHSLELSRSRIEKQLEKAVQPAHRAMLMKALQALEKEVEDSSVPA